MKVLVTGAAGFIGSNIVKLLESKGARVIALDDFSHANYKNLMGTKADVVCADVSNGEIFKKLPKVETVIHEAAITDTTFKDDTVMMAVNTEGFRNVLNFCLGRNLKLVYASSAATYGDGSSPMAESQPPRPLNIYGYSKYLCDCIARPLFGKKGVPLIVGLRYFNVYGPGEYHKGPAASMTYQLYLQMKAGKRPRVFRNGEQKRDFIYVKDIARVTVGALNLKKSTILNAGTGKPASFNEMIANLNKALGTDLEPDYFDNPYVGLYQDITRADTGQLDKLNLGAEFTFAQGVADYVKNYLEKK
jgi:ADP-L-glycero-D-manno-heptose 6-epimerase